MACLDYTPSQGLKIQLGSYYLAALEMKSIQKNLVNGKFFTPNKFSFYSLLIWVDSDPTYFCFSDLLFLVLLESS